MNVLGVHRGRDSSAALVKDGKIVREAIRCFFDDGLDVLVLGNFLLEKKNRVEIPGYSSAMNG